MYGFAPFTENGKEVVRDINIRLYSVCDSTRRRDTIDEIRYLYVVENGDKKTLPHCLFFLIFKLNSPEVTKPGSDLLKKHKPFRDLR